MWKISGITMFTMLIFLLVTGCNNGNAVDDISYVYDDIYTENEVAETIEVLTIHSGIEYDEWLIAFLELNFDFFMQEHPDTDLFFSVTVFDFDIPLPLEGLKAMYRELNTHFDYVLIHGHQFEYIGYYSGDEIFVNTPPTPIHGVHTRNRILTDADGNEFYFTPLRGIQMGRMLVGHFDDRIAEGRNFTDDDFYVNYYGDTVNVILGYNYIGVHEIGDILALRLYAAKTLSFEVIGFFEQGTAFPQMNCPIEYHCFDSSIIMPYFAVIYEPFDEDNLRFQTILYIMKTMGYIKIAESTQEITESIESFDRIYARYFSRLNELASRHGLEFDIPLLPIPNEIQQ